MFSTTDFKRGLKILLDNTPFEIVEFQHFKPGKGGAMIRTKLRNLLTGRVVDKTFRSGEKVGRPDIEHAAMQYLYMEGNNLVLMDLGSYEQHYMSSDNSDGAENFLKDGQEVKVMLYNGDPLILELPASLVFEVTHTEPGAKGDTVSNVTKPATIETGLEVNVPLFINIGDKIKIDTRTREYLGRENS